MSTFVQSGWLTERRIRAHGLLLAICLWSVYAVDLTAPGLRDRFGFLKGTDFLHFYTLGHLALAHRGDLLYDLRAQAALMANLVPQSAGRVFVPLYAPQVSLLFVPLARLPYLWAFTVWTIFNVAVYFLCCYAIWKRCRNLCGNGATVFVLALAFPGFFHLVVWGQSSALALVCFTLAFLALRDHRDFLAGLALGMLICKPQLGLAAAFLFLLTARWKILLGGILGAFAQLSIGWCYYGAGVMRSYAHALWHLRDIYPLIEPRPYQNDSLLSFWSMLLPWPTLALWTYLASALIVLAITIAYWKSSASLELRFSALLLASILLAPHATVYDLVILAPAYLLIADAMLPDSRRVAWLLYLSFPVFLLAPLARVTHVQWSVLVIVVLLWTLYGSAKPAPSA